MKKKVSKNRERSNAKDRVEAYKESVRDDFEFSTRFTLNQQFIPFSAVNSLQEGLEETLTLHRLGLAEKLSVSFRTTHCIESLNRQLEIYTGRVSYWQNSKQRQLW